MKIIFNLTLDNGTVIGGVENDLRDLVINGVTVVSNGRADTIQIEEITGLSDQFQTRRLEDLSWENVHFVESLSKAWGTTPCPWENTPNVAVMTAMKIL
jgi:hypothetical protein